jgi:hypothetical protein
MPPSFSAPAPQGLPQQTPVWGLGPLGETPLLIPAYFPRLCPPCERVSAGRRDACRLPFWSGTESPAPSSLLLEASSPAPSGWGWEGSPEGGNEKPDPPTRDWDGGGGRDGSVAWRRAGVLLPNLPPHPSPAWGEETPSPPLLPSVGEPSPLSFSWVSRKKGGEARGICPLVCPGGEPSTFTGGGWAPPPPWRWSRGRLPSSRRQAPP